MKIKVTNTKTKSHIILDGISIEDIQNNFYQKKMGWDLNYCVLEELKEEKMNTFIENKIEEFHQDMKLTKELKPKDKIIKTTQGDFKIRKNGRICLCIEPDTERMEMVRVTPIITR